MVDFETSIASSTLNQLTSDQQHRLTGLLDEYLQNREGGVVPDAHAIAAENPDIAAAFLEYLQKLEAIFGLTGETDNSQRSADQLPLKQLGEFELIRELGRGGMGVVYEATQKSIGRRVALKLLAVSSALDPRQVARFHNESRAAGMLQHPNIVPVYNVGTHQGIHYYAMQMIEGQSIDHWIELAKQSSPTGDATQQPACTNWRQVVGWIQQIAQALQVAHEAGIIHRDVKPSNLLLDQQNRIWITDFGLARCSINSSVTVSGDLVGTMRYMSPEQASGGQSIIDSGADIYGLAVTLYEMLTLRPAIVGSDAAAILRGITDQVVQPVRQLRPDVPRSLQTVIDKAMAKFRSNRYQSMAQFAEDLDCVLTNRPTLARPATAIESMGQWVGRHQQAVLSITAVLLLTIVGLAASITLINYQKKQTELVAHRNETNERLAREAIDQLGAEMSELLVDIPAANAVRKRLLEQTLSYYQQYALNAQNSPDLSRSLAVTLGKIGVLKSELGSTDEALEALRDSEQTFAALARSAPSQIANQLEWSISLNNLGQAQHQAGQLMEAEANIRSAIDLQSEIVDQHPSAEHLLQLATSANNLGLLLAEEQQEAAAKDAFRRAIDTLESISPADNSSTSATLLCAVQTNLAGLLGKSSDEEAVRMAKLALEREVTLLEKLPDNANLSRQTVRTLCVLAAAQVESRQWQSAEESYLRAIDIATQLVTRWPDQPDYRSDLATAYNQLGVTYMRDSRTADAIKSFESALEHQFRLANRFINDAEIQSATGNMLNNFAFLSQRLHLDNQAKTAFEQAIQYQSKAVALAPQNQRYAEYLSKHRSNLLAVESHDP